MSTPPHETNHRAMREQQVHDRALTIVQGKYPQLAPSQHKALALAIQKHAAFVEFTNTGTLDPGDDWIRMELDAQEYLAKGQEHFRIAPDAQMLKMALIAKLPPNAPPQEQINISRRVDRMSDDERLAASEGLDLKPAPKAKEKPDTRTQEQKARNYTAEDVELERRGYVIRDLDPQKRQELRREVQKENAPRSTRFIEEVRLMRKLGKEPATTVLMTAAREAKELGKTLEEALR